MNKATLYVVKEVNGKKALYPVKLYRKAGDKLEPVELFKKAK